MQAEENGKKSDSIMFVALSPQNPTPTYGGSSSWTVQRIVPKWITYK